jgi:hypothetical protein
VLPTSEPSTTVAPQVAEYLRYGAPPGRGRRVVPSDSGSLIANVLRLRSLSIPTINAGPIELGPCTVAIAHRPEALGVAGLLGVDLLRRFVRICYEAGPPALLTLEA